MKAAVLHAFGETPRYEEFAEPRADGGHAVVEVLAVALQNAERALASGAHYASRSVYPALPAIVGIAGIGRVDGRTVAFGGCVAPYGALAERALVPRAAADAFVTVPDGIDPALAVAIPSSAITSLAALRDSGALVPGETVLVQGATGFAGRLAVQIAKKLGAGRVVGSGRDPASLQAIRELGADAVIDLTQPDAAVKDAFAREAGEGYGVVVDYLWGRPTELLLATLAPKSFAPPRVLTRVVHIGAAAGSTIALVDEMVRTSGVSILGTGGRLDRARILAMTATVFDWIETGQIRAEVERVPLADVERAWGQTTHGSRLVVRM